jgi:hypothetical protein
MFNFFKNKAKSKVKKAAIYFTGSKIVIFTMDFTDTNTSLLSNKLSVLNIDCTNQIIAEKVLYHASLSENLPIKITNQVDYYKDVLKLAGFKTIKEANANTRYISFEQIEGKISIFPFTNINSSKKNQYYLRQVTDIVEVNQAITTHKIGRLIEDLKNKCNFQNN